MIPHAINILDGPRCVLACNQQLTKIYRWQYINTLYEGLHLNIICLERNVCKCYNNLRNRENHHPFFLYRFQNLTLSLYCSNSSIQLPLLSSIFAGTPGQALVKMTFRVAEQTNKKKSVEERGAQCKLEAGALLEESKNN